jgi:hypothetical protein
LSDTFTERRKVHVHMIGDRRRWVEPVSHTSAPRVHAMAIGGTTLVVTTSVLLGRADPRMILFVPLFALYAVMLLVVRQIKLQVRYA